MTEGYPRVVLNSLPDQHQYASLPHPSRPTVTSIQISFSNVLLKSTS